MNLNISIDDVSPHPRSSLKVVERCERIRAAVPGAKFTLFVPIGYWRTQRAGTITSDPLYLHHHPDFCEVLARLPTDVYEVGFHGLHHGIPGVSDNDEFQHLTSPQASEIFDVMFDIVSKAGLSHIFCPIFRPPAWRMSPGSIEAARRKGMKVLALSPQDYARRTYEGHDIGPDVFYYGASPPLEPLPVNDFERLLLVYHACEWDKNHLDAQKADELTKWLIGRPNVCMQSMMEMSHARQ